MKKNPNQIALAVGAIVLNLLAVASVQAADPKWLSVYQRKITIDLSACEKSWDEAKLQCVVAAPLPVQNIVTNGIGLPTGRNGTYIDVNGRANGGAVYLSTTDAQDAYGIIVQVFDPAQDDAKDWKTYGPVISQFIAQAYPDGMDTQYFFAPAGQALTADGQTWTEMPGQVLYVDRQLAFNLDACEPTWTSSQPGSGTCYAKATDNPGITAWDKWGFGVQGYNEFNITDDQGRDLYVYVWNLLEGSERVYEYDVAPMADIKDTLTWSDVKPTLEKARTRFLDQYNKTDSKILKYYVADGSENDVLANETNMGRVQLNNGQIEACVTATDGTSTCSVIQPN